MGYPYTPLFSEGRESENLISEQTIERLNKSVRLYANDFIEYTMNDYKIPDKQRLIEKVANDILLNFAKSQLEDSYEQDTSSELETFFENKIDKYEELGLVKFDSQDFNETQDKSKNGEIEKFDELIRSTIFPKIKQKFKNYELNRYPSLSKFKGKIIRAHTVIPKNWEDLGETRSTKESEKLIEYLNTLDEVKNNKKIKLSIYKGFGGVLIEYTV